MPDMANLVIEVTPKGIADAKNQLDTLASSAGLTEKKTSSLMDKFRNMQSVMQGPVAAFKEVANVMRAVYAAGKELVDTYGVQERAVSNLEAVLKSTGGTVGKTSKELQDMASALQGATTFGDEAIINMNAILLGFRSITGDQFERTTKGILDMATVMGTDLPAAANMLGKALDSPTQGMSALTRVGFVFTDEQKKMVKALEESGDMLGAQDVILQEVEKAFGGAAEAAGKLATGSFKQLANSTGDLKEQLGRMIAEGMKPFNIALKGMIDSVTAAVKAENDLNDAYKADARGTASMQQKLLILQAQRDTQQQIVDSLNATSVLYEDLGGASQQQRDDANAALAALNSQLALITQAIAMNERGQKAMSEAEAKRLADEKRANEWRLKAAEIMQVIADKGSGAEIADRYLQKLMKDVELAVTFGDDISEAVEEAQGKVRRTIEELLKSGLFSESDMTVHRLRENYAALGKLAKEYAETTATTTAVTAASLEKTEDQLEREKRLEEEKAARQWLIMQGEADGAKRAEVARKAEAEAIAEADAQLKEYNETLNKIKDVIKNTEMEVFVGGFEELGKQLQTGQMNAESFSLAMADIGIQMLHQLPLLFLSAGLQAIALGRFEIGLSLIAASGISAIASGYASSAYSKSTKPVTASAHGNVFGWEGMQMFATGGAFTNKIVSKPTLFGYGGSFVGEMGEAGPEAIVPLTRMGNGNLGVESTPSNVIVNIIDQTEKGTSKTTEESTGPDGTKVLTVFIRDVVKKEFSNGGLDVPMQARYGVSAVGVRRS